MTWWKKFLNAVKFPRQFIYGPRRAARITGGVPVNEDTAMQVAAFYRGVIYISSQIAKLPWEVKNKKNEILFNNISKLLNVRPNPEMGAFAFRLCMVQNAIIHGNSFAEIERDAVGRPTALWPIKSEWVQVYRVPATGELIYRIIGGSNISPGEDVFLPFNDMYHLKNFHTKDGLVGQGVVSYAMDVLGIGLGADRMAGNLFANGGMPSGIISIDGALDDDAYKRIEDSWKANHGGKKSGGVAVFEEGAKFTPVTMAPDIMQFLESRKFTVLEAARFLGLPPTKLFDTDAATYNNTENSNLEVAVDTLDSWARNCENEADMKLLNNQYGGIFTEMDLYAVFRGDMKTRSEYFSKQMQTASITPNEIRQKEGLPPYVGGDRYFLAVNNYTPMDRIDEVVDSQISKSKNSGGQGKTIPAPTEKGNPSTPSNRLEEAAAKFLESN